MEWKEEVRRKEREQQKGGKGEGKELEWRKERSEKEVHMLRKHEKSLKKCV